MADIETAIANRADESYVTDNDCITVGQIRDLLDVVKALSDANQILARKLMVGAHGLVPAPGRKPQGV